MEHYTIASFVDGRSGRMVSELSVFISGSTGLLLERGSGHILLLDKMYIEEIENREISKPLLCKLESRGFVERKEKEYFHNLCDVQPEFFMVDLTDKCNMRCKYCLRNVGASDESITDQVLSDICSYINAYCEKEHLKHVSIQPWGGEPLLELDRILQMREWIHPAGTKIHFSIETIGVLLDQDTIDQLYNYKIGIGISIDGFAKVHDSQRVMASGCGSHSKIERNLLWSKKKYGSRLGTITTVTRNNAQYIEEILEYFACVLKLPTIKINFVHESMFSDSESICLSGDEISVTETRILNKLVELNERGLRISEHNIKVKINNLLFGRYSDICHSKGCMGGKKMIVFDKKGNIYPCELTDTPDERIGSIYDRADLISLVSSAFNNRDFFVPKKAESCCSCEWHAFCQGGCTVRTISCGKRPPQIDLIECAVNRALYPALVELIITNPAVVNALLGIAAL